MNRWIIVSGALFVVGSFFLFLFVIISYTCFKAWAGLPLDFLESERDCQHVAAISAIVLAAAFCIIPLTLGTMFLAKGLKVKKQ